MCQMLCTLGPRADRTDTALCARELTAPHPPGCPRRWPSPETPTRHSLLLRRVGPSTQLSPAYHTGPVDTPWPWQHHVRRQRHQPQTLVLPTTCQFRRCNSQKGLAKLTNTSNFLKEPDL